MAMTSGSPAMFGTAGPAAHQIAVLGWVLTIISLAVLLVVSLILLVASFASAPRVRINPKVS